MTDCVIYARISLDKTGEGAGVERQETECRALAARLGLNVLRTLVDNDISATTGKRRPAFEELFVLRPAAVVVWHMDRLVRLSKDLERVLDLGVTVHSVTSGHLDLSNPAGQATAKTVVAWAQYEGQQKSARQKSAHVQRRALGGHWWSTAPFGWDMQGGVVDDEAAVLRWAAEAVLDGWTNMAAIAREVTASGWAGRRGAPWNQSDLRKALVGERNAEILGPDVHRAVRDALAPRRTGGGPIAMLTGVCVCGVCGRPCGGSKEYGRLRYKCRAGHVAWPREIVDEAVGPAVERELAKADLEPVASAADLGAELHALALDFAARRLTVLEFTTGTERAHARAALARPTPLRPWRDLDTPARREVCKTMLAGVVLPQRGAGVRSAPLDVLMLVWQDGSVSGVDPPAAAG